MLRSYSEPVELGPVTAERTLTLFTKDGSALPITVRLGRPFVGTPFQAPGAPEYRCALQILGVGDERMIAPWGEDPFVALQYAIDLIGQLLDELMRSEKLEMRFRSSEDRNGWIWRYPPH